MFQGYYNKEQDATDIRDTDNQRELTEFEHEWILVCESEDRDKVAEQLDVIQDQRNIRINSM